MIAYDILSIDVDKYAYFMQNYVYYNCNNTKHDEYYQEYSTKKIDKGTGFSKTNCQSYY